MKYRRFGKTGWQVSEMGYGMWGLVGWKDSDDKEIEASLNRAVELGCNFFDTAWGYGEGRSEEILGKLIKTIPVRTYMPLPIASKNRKWPSRSTLHWMRYFRKSTSLNMQRRA
jgi:aryl-alcohol dehydrogenase-like predicted oxidoreductase